MDALIGATGFVGSNLTLQHQFELKFNSKNITESRNNSFDTVVCAAAPATMWAANKNPALDLQNIKNLVSNLEQIKAKKFVLLSSIAVLGDSVGLDESTTHFEEDKAYGRNRRFLEEAVASIFPSCHIIRLPALFGVGLKKNFLYDILNPVPSFISPDKFEQVSKELPDAILPIFSKIYSLDDATQMYVCNRAMLDGDGRSQLTDALSSIGFTALGFTNSNSTFQYYNLANLWSDIAAVIENDLSVVHLAPPPLKAGTVYEHLTGKMLLHSDKASIYHENMKTLHSKHWMKDGDYIRSEGSVLADLNEFYTKNVTL